ncbi:hypothetical protein A2859_00990 [Candidatus Roizmanbacteria bacterium RIFCSPHIGHO2_01_FULL_37_16b]|nr:MAG: hypothetical protein A2859_00990 [Candidatus Roizmanbacteria bacterium RIFCSPHIGHO2_01_FULL_37_16b]
MKLPFFKKNTNEGKNFFGILLKENEGIGLVIKIKNSNFILVDQEKFTFTNAWENIAEDLDGVILRLEQRTKLKLNETIFFVYSHFVDEKTKEIKKPYLQKIKELVNNLNLKALGFIECYEAITHYLEKKEEIPLTAILMELDHSNLSIFVFKRGGLTYSKVLAHTNNVIDDLLTCFIEIKGKFVLPSRIILYDSKDLDKESTDIVTYRWSEELFVQLPRVEIIKEHELIQGLLGVFGEQVSQKISGTKFIEEKPPTEVLGFVIGGDVTKQAQTPSFKKDTSLKLAKPSLASISSWINPIINLLKSIPMVFNKKWTIILGLILVMTALLLTEYFLHKARLTIFLSSKTIKKDINLTSDELKIESFSKSVDLTDSKSTSGKKEVGEKARGSVTIHNFDDNEKLFTKGTTLETAGLKFNLDQDVKVASASVVTISGGIVKQPGKTKTNLTALEIGPQNNLGSGKQFKIDDLLTSLYFGINENAFSGGTKKEVKTVSAKDMEELRKSIQEQGKRQKLDQQDTKKNLDKKVLTDLIEFVLTEEKFGQELGEESDKLTLKSKVKATIYLYEEKELKDLITKKLTKELEKGYVLERQKLLFTINNAIKKNDRITLVIDMESKAVKDVPIGDIVRIIRGKSRKNLESSLKANFAAEGFELEINPKLPLLQNWLPFLEKNIDVKISSM